MVPDTRAERGKTQIVSPASWKLLFDRTEALPPTIQHIIVCTTVPVLYPKVGCQLCCEFPGPLHLYRCVRLGPCRLLNIARVACMLQG